MMCGCELTEGVTQITFKIGPTKKEVKAALKKLSEQKQTPSQEGEEEN
jgi:hypothetical protein